MTYTITLFKIMWKVLVYYLNHMTQDMSLCLTQLYYIYIIISK